MGLIVLVCLDLVPLKRCITNIHYAFSSERVAFKIKIWKNHICKNYFIVRDLFVYIRFSDCINCLVL